MWRGRAWASVVVFVVLAQFLNSAAAKANTAGWGEELALCKIASADACLASAHLQQHIFVLQYYVV
jgi:hypothetical protein